jgi:hypothetical protein
LPTILAAQVDICRPVFLFEIEMNGINSQPDGIGGGDV